MKYKVRKINKHLIILQPSKVGKLFLSILKDIHAKRTVLKYNFKLDKTIELELA